jgi:hypothetical protein
MGTILLFLAGALLCNAIPHLTQGLSGRGFPTPFAKPRGIGLSSPVVNVLWGTANLYLGAILVRGHAAMAGTGWGLFVLMLGFLALGCFCARHFGRVFDN